jgi:hypothetical protein
LFNPNNLLINGADVNVSLTRSATSFYLLGPSDDAKVRVTISDATLFVTQVELNPAVLLAHAKVLSQKKALYPITHAQIKTFTTGAGAQQISIDDAFPGPVPQRIFIGIVKSSAFVGSVSKNPYKFQHYDLNYFALYVNGIQYPTKPLSSVCGAIRAYETLFSATGIHHDDRSHMITTDMFHHGYFLLGFDLTPDKSADESHISLPRQGNVRIEARFKSALPEAVIYILYMPNTQAALKSITVETLNEYFSDR